MSHKANNVPWHDFAQRTTRDLDLSTEGLQQTFISHVHMYRNRDVSIVGCEIHRFKPQDVSLQFQL